MAVGKEADLLVLSKRRLFWPPQKYTWVPVLDALLDRANASDLETVMIAGRVVFDGGEILTVDERRVLADFAEAGRDRLWVLTDDVRGQMALASEIEPYVLEFYRRWAETPVTPASVYNARSVPPGTESPQGEATP